MVSENDLDRINRELADKATSRQETEAAKPPTVRIHQPVWTGMYMAIGAMVASAVIFGLCLILFGSFLGVAVR